MGFLYLEHGISISFQNCFIYLFISVYCHVLRNFEHGLKVIDMLREGSAIYVVIMHIRKI